MNKEREFEILEYADGTFGVRHRDRRKLMCERAYSIWIDHYERFGSKAEAEIYIKSQTVVAKWSA